MEVTAAQQRQLGQVVDSRKRTHARTNIAPASSRQHRPRPHHATTMPPPHQQHTDTPKAHQPRTPNPLPHTLAHPLAYACRSRRRRCCRPRPYHATTTPPPLRHRHRRTNANTYTNTNTDALSSRQPRIPPPRPPPSPTRAGPAAAATANAARDVLYLGEERRSSKADARGGERPVGGRGLLVAGRAALNFAQVIVIRIVPIHPHPHAHPHAPIR